MTVSITVVEKLAEAMGGEILPDNKQYTNRFEIRSSSSDKLYVIAQRKSDEEWCCGCPGWVFTKAGRERNCKHLKTLRPLLEGVQHSRPSIAAAKPKLVAVKEAPKPRKKAAAKKKAVAVVAQPAGGSLLEAVAMATMAGHTIDNLPLPAEVQERYAKRIMKIQAQIEALADDLRDE
jgi:hypothetical protein